MQNERSIAVLYGIAIVGLLVYAMTYKMDATVSSMLSGLFGVLIGRMSRGGNGNGNGNSKP